MSWKKPRSWPVSRGYCPEDSGILSQWDNEAAGQYIKSLKKNLVSTETTRHWDR